MTARLEELRGRLRAERISRNVSLERVGELCHPPVVRTSVHAWETGSVRLPVDALDAYEAALGMPIDIVIGGDRRAGLDLDTRRTALLDECIGVLQGLEDEDIPAFRTLLRAFKKDAR